MKGKGRRSPWNTFLSTA